MRILRFTAALLSLLAVLVFGSAYAPEPLAECGHGEAALAQLEASSDVADTPPLHSIGEFFARGSVVESPRRLTGARLQIAAASFAVVPPADETNRATLLELRRAERDRREIGTALLRDAAGAISFHTTTPPPLHA